MSALGCGSTHQAKLNVGLRGYCGHFKQEIYPSVTSRKVLYGDGRKDVLISISPRKNYLLSATNDIK